MISLEAIAGALCQKYDVPLIELTSERKGNKVVPIRHEAWYLSIKDAGRTANEIGAFYNRNRTSILSGVVAHCKRNGLTDPRTGKDYGGGA